MASLGTSKPTAGKKNARTSAEPQTRAVSEKYSAITAVPRSELRVRPAVGGVQRFDLRVQRLGPVREAERAADQQLTGPRPPSRHGREGRQRAELTEVLC
ncbi:MAG: hypothetical protein ACRD0K_20600, partial [Egibacteraceae bacterium]